MRDLWWKRFGCREITIPINWASTRMTNNVVQKWILAEELGANNKELNNQFYRKNGLNEIVGQSPSNQLFNPTLEQNPLKFKMLPGEGKIIKVKLSSNIVKITDLKTTLTTVSLTSKRIQAKIAKHKTQSEVAGDEDTCRKVYYHSVYQRMDVRDSIVKTYYSRSEPMDSTINPNESAIWQNERLISVHNIKIDSNFRDYRKSYIERIDTLDETHFDTVRVYDPYFRFKKAGHPEITVKDSMVHIVYNLEPDSLYQNGEKVNLAIAECVFNANDSIQVVPDSINIIATVNADTAQSDTWGIPSINSSSQGCFYAWNSPEDGIVAGFKATNDSGMITNKFTLHNLDESICGRPNLNRYSRANENNCAMVWSEEVEGRTSIFYTRLIFDDSQSDIYPLTAHKFQNQNIEDNAAWKVEENNFRPWDGFSPTALISEYYYVKNPVVYRALQPLNNNIIYDRIYWESAKPCEDFSEANVESRSLYSKLINIYDAVNNPLLIARPEIMIFSEEEILNQPDVAQGFGDMINGDSSICVSATKSNSVGADVTAFKFNHGLFNIYDAALNSDNIYRLGYFDPAAITTFKTNTAFTNILRRPKVEEIESQDLSYVFYSDFNGAICNDGQTISYKRSVNETFSENNEEANGKEYAMPIIGFGTQDSVGKYSYISGIYDISSNKWLKYKYGYKKIDSSKVRLDSIYSEWMNIGQLKNIGFGYFNKVDTNVRVFIEKMNDSVLINVSQFIGEMDTLAKNQLSLINGEFDSYRILILKKDANSIFRGAYSIGKGLQFDNPQTSYKSGSAGKSENIIDLGGKQIIKTATINEATLKLYPNSANGDYVYAVLYGDEELNKKSDNLKLNLTIHTILGEKVFDGELNINEVRKLDISKIANGSYIVNVQIIDKKDEFIISTKTSPLSIAR